MTATLLHRSGERATVRLTPSWWERLWGTQMVDVELVRDGYNWRTEATRRDIDHVKHGREIKHALDFVPVGEVPRAVVGPRYR